MHESWGLTRALPVLPQRKQHGSYSPGLRRWSRGSLLPSGGPFQGKFNDDCKRWMICRVYRDEEAGRKPYRT